MLEAVRLHFDLPWAIVSSIERQRYTIDHVAGAAGAPERGCSFNLAETFCERVIELEKPLYIHEAGKSLFKNHPCYKRQRSETYLGVRLLVQGRVFGTLSLTAPETRGEPFTADDKMVFETAGVLISQHLALRMADERFELAVSGSAVGLWDWDVRTDALFWSPRLMDMLDVGETGFRATFDEFADRLHSEDRDRVMVAVNAHLSERLPYDIEYRLRRDRGDFIWVRARGQATWASDGTALRMAGSIDDITTRKTQQEKMRLQAEALRQSNSELERFAYVASHDLQEPLRKVASFGDLLKRDYAGRLDARGVNLVDVMTGAAGRMQRLIRDLLDYSRSNHVELDIQDIDFSALVAEIVTDFELDLTACGGRVECDNRETVRADPVLLRQLLHNLIGNAVKYRSADRSLVVRLVLEREGTDRWLLHIHDNGIGFSAKYSDQIFKVFKRLHSRAEFPGTGVGLAMCHRIADRHGGQIWADSVPGCGASFHVSLPRAPEDIYAPMRGPD